MLPSFKEKVIIYLEGTHSHAEDLLFQRSSEEESSFHKERIAQAKLIMKPFILRRVKSEVDPFFPQCDYNLIFDIC